MQIKKKEITFRGKSIEDLNKLDVREFAALLRSRQRRTILRNFQKHENFIKRAKNQLDKGKRSIKTHFRDLVIVPELVGIRLQVYNGREFIPFDVTIEMLGHKFGEFAPTRARARHNKDDKKKK